MVYRRIFEVSSFYYVPILIIDEKGGKIVEVKTHWEEDFRRLGFTQDDKGLWVPPKEFSFGDPTSREKGIVRLPSDPFKWHKIYKYFSPAQVEGDPSHALIRILFQERFESRDDSYEFNLLSKFYPSLNLKKKERIYTKVLNTPLNTFEDWLNFPFKPRTLFTIKTSNEGNAIETLIDSKVKQDCLKEYTDKFISKKLTYEEIKTIQSYFKEEFSTELNEQVIDPDFPDQKEVYTFLSWDAFWFWEFYQDVKKEFGLSKCVLCGNYLRGHEDKMYCSRAENPECFKEQQTIKKRKSRKNNKRS